MRMEAKVNMLCLWNSCIERRLLTQMHLLSFSGDVCPHAEVSQAGGVGKVASEAGAGQGVLPHT